MLLVVAVAATAVPSSAAAHGNAGGAALQVTLRARGTYIGAIDGMLGPLTVSATMRLEQKLALPPSGRPTEALRAALGPWARWSLGERTLVPGAVGWDAAAFQFLLAWRGFPSGPIDGA